MNAPMYLSWENFRSTILVRGQQRLHRIASDPLVEVFGDGEASRIGIWLAAPSGTTVSGDLTALEFMTSRMTERDGIPLLEVATTAASLHRQFYHFALAVAERVIVEKRLPTEAVELELRCFTDLLEERSCLSIERQIGLLGELLFLERLASRSGTEALDSWLGPAGEPHDFRIRNSEFEVKTTLATRRVHTIHGMEQLVPSKDCTLSLVSILLGPPGLGYGFSLSDKVAELWRFFSADAMRASRFESALQASGYRAADRGRYSRRFAPRRPLGVIPVNDRFPVITRPTIQGTLGPLASRVESFQYEVNVEGLEYEDGTPSFEALIP